MGAIKRHNRDKPHHKDEARDGTYNAAFFEQIVRREVRKALKPSVTAAKQRH